MRFIKIRVQTRGDVLGIGKCRYALVGRGGR